MEMEINMKLKKLFLTATLLILAILFGMIQSSAQQNDKNAPIRNGSKKWRIAYCQSGPYLNYTGTLFYLVQGLQKLGWLNNVDGIPYTWGNDDSRAVWDYLRKEDIGSYIEFVEDGFYSFSEGEDVEANAIERLTQKKDIDLIIVMGTVAGKSITAHADDIDAPIMVFSTSNAVLANISNTVEYSGRDNVWAHTDPNRYKQQLQVFHDIFQFSNLGIVYDKDHPNAPIFAAVDDVNQIAVERQFKVINRSVTSTTGKDDQDRYFEYLLKIHTELAEEVDAFYYAIAPFPGLKKEHLFDVLKPFYDKNIPVFSQLGEEEVKFGALMSIARPDFSGVGLFGADKITRALHGEKPGTLFQKFSNTPAIALNLEVADMIGYEIPFEVLLVSDIIYQKIDK
jgi:ABC-type uncharacterized transport system substrate-binding protein